MEYPHPLTTENHYPSHMVQPQGQSQGQSQWPPHLLTGNQSSFPSPISPPTSSMEYPPYFHRDNPPPHLERTSSSLSLNLSTLSVTSPTSVSPINPPPVPNALSPVTPLSPQTSYHHHIPHSFQYPDQNQTQSQPQSQAHSPIQSHPQVSLAQGPQSQLNRYEEQHQQPYEGRQLHTHASSTSRSSSSSSASMTRKRSFTSNPSHNPVSSIASASTSTTTLLEEPPYDDASMDLAYDEMGSYGANGPNANGGPDGSPVDGSVSGDGGDDPALGLGVNSNSGTNGTAAGMGAGMNVLGKPMGTNNFVTKLYGMINDPKSAQFISWTDLGTSFVVTNVAEFSRSILGSHFKHNNFSSFVRQLNMYGFHKINRTPRAQRSTTDVQTWEFSHHKFLRARPDLLDEIKRKALEPDPGVKHRVELPGEVAAQLGAMREENKRLWEQMMEERRKVDRLVGLTGKLWEVVGRGFPNSLPPYPADLLEATEGPGIYITSPSATSSRYPPPLSMNMSSHSLHSIGSANSSPTQSDFSAHTMHSHTLSRQHSFQHISYRGENNGPPSTPLPASPGSTPQELYEGGHEPDGGRQKRQRTSSGHGVILTNGDAGGAVASTKRLSRARSDSAPLGYGLGMGLNSWHGNTRPRSGSGMVPPVPRMAGIPSLSGVMPRGPPMP